MQSTDQFEDNNFIDQTAKTLLGVSFRSAPRIDMELLIVKSALRADSSGPISRFDFGRIKAANPFDSLGSNIIVEYSGTAAGINRVGVQKVAPHVVLVKPDSYSHNSPIFTHFGANFHPSSFNFAVIIYLHKEKGLEWLRMGVLLGLDDAGDFDSVGYFYACDSEYWPSGKYLQKSISDSYWHAYLIFSAFSLMNTGVEHRVD